jgi:hypothetical protein
MTTQTPFFPGVLPSASSSVLAILAVENPVGKMSVIKTNRSNGISVGAKKRLASAIGSRIYSA